ncbi:MAG TPA: alpha/beta hydrolase, partial [Polyangiaceae bacterium]
MAAPRDPDDERSDANLEEIEHDAPSPTIPPVEPQRIFPLTRDVAARGARVRFVEIGEGPPVLMIHGYLANHAAWDHLLDSFGKRFRTIAPDLPGFGDSEKPSPSRYAYNADAFAESLVDLVAALGLGRVAVVGHDLGGSVALTMAARHPSIVQRLVLVDPLVYPHQADVYSRVATTPVVGPITFKQLSGRGIFTRYFKGRNYATPEAAPHGKVDRFFEHFNAPAARESAYATLESL